MADPLSPPAEDPFTQIIGGGDPASVPPDRGVAASASPDAASVRQDNDPFSEFDQVGPSPVSATGAFARGAEKSAIPAVGSLPAIGAGAEAGAVVGAFGGPVGAAVGGVIGGVLGGVGASYALSEVQNWAVKKLPDSWRDKLGLDDRSERLDAEQHPTASFMGGLVPLAVTMNPTAAARDLPANATALQQIMAHPVTSRMFGGGVMGGMEVGNEKLHGGDIDWRKTAIATTFGVVMNRPNRVGERLIDVGAYPARVVMGRPEPVSAATVAQAADAKVMGPGVTEGVFRGTEEQAPAAAQTAQENARIEQDAIGEPPTPDLHGIARQMEPDLFAQYDELLKRRETFETWHGEGPGHEMAEKHLAATNAEIAEMGPTVAAAYRRAADTVGTGTIEAQQFPSFAAMLAAHEHGTGRPADAQPAAEVAETPNAGEAGVPAGGEAPVNVEGPQPVAAFGSSGPERTIGEQRAFIANDVSQKLIAAGRPPEEAEAAGKIIAARYITRAGRFEGKLGTAEELYAREGAAIAGPNERPQVPSGAPVAPPAGAIAKRGRAAADPKTWSLYEFLASEGGLKPTPDLVSIFGGKNPFVPGFGPLLRPTGLALDEALTRAKEQSYILDPNDIQHLGHDATRRSGELTVSVNDLHDMIAEESRGRKNYRTDHVQPEAKVNPEEERGAILDALHRELLQTSGEAPKVDPALEDRVVEIIQKEGEHDVLAAYERAIMEDHDSYEGLRNDRQSAEPIPGWDDHDAGAASGRGEANIGERGQAGLPEQEAGARDGGEPRGNGEGNRAQTSAIAAWDDLASRRLTRRETLKPSSGFNTDRSRSGDLLRGKASQVWQLGNLVNVGFLKDLIIAKANGDGSFELLSKPDQNGMSRVYDAKPHEGISGNAKKVDFLERARDVISSHEMAQSVDEYFQRVYYGDHQPEFELGADGKPQQLIPGVAPVSQRDLVQAAANKPMRGGNAPPPEGGLFGDTANQKELFQSARGKIRIAEGRRPVITLMKDANPSTFIHESGHQFLEELMHDSMHPDAPMQLRDDAQTVRDWLGVMDDVKTRHHEKFARGFEQYVREGVAPSPELAGVFAKFRNWLMSIYQSIKGLGTEISPEIRSVFDRMLEMEPQRTVVAPERASPTLLHDIHEAEAQHIEPHEAEGAMDRIVAERDRYIAEQPPEIQRELETAAVKVQQARDAAAAEGGAGDQGPSEVVGDRGGPVSEPGGGAGGAEPGAVKPGSGGAGTESADVQRPDLRSKLGDHAGTALAPGPTDLFGARESRFTDRAGNIRLDTLNTAEDVKQALRDSAAENNDFIGDRRGVVTDGQVLELANDIGMSGAENLVKKHVTGQAYNAEQVVALRKLLRESAANVSTAAKKAATSGLDEDVLAYAQAKDRLQMVQKTVAGVTAEAGRALRAFRTLPGEADTTALEQMIKEATGKTLFQLKQEAKLASAIETPQNMNKFMQGVDRHSGGDMLLEGWINGLLSGPATQITNIMGNAVFAIQHFGPEKVVAGLIGSAAHAVGREGTYTRVGETVAAARGLKEGAAPALQATGQAFRRGASTLLPGEEGPASGILEGIVHDDMIPRGTLDEATTMRDVGAGLFGIVRGIPDAIMTGGALLRAGGVEGSPLWNTKYGIQGAIPDIQIRGMNVLPVGTVVRLPGRFLATMDTFFRSLNYSMAKNGIAYRMASDEGLSGVEFAQRVAEIRDNPSPEVMEQARSTATETTFMDKGGQFVRALNNLTSREANLPLLGPTKPLKFVAPFTNVVSRILEQTIVKRTPLGILSQELRNDLIGRNGNVAQDTAAARMLLGSTLMLGFGSLAAQGYITGSGPKDPKENAIWRTVYQPHSVRIGDMYYQIQKLGPMGMLMGLAADLHDMGHLIAEDKYAEAGGFLLHAIVQNVLDQSAMQGPAEIIKAIEDPDRYGPQYIKSFLSSFVPNVIGSYARARDPYIRQTWGIVDALKQKLPGYSEELHPRIDIWGEPVPHREALGGAGVTGVYVQKMNADPVNRAMIDLGIHPGAVEKKIRNIELTPQQYEDFARIAGRMTKQRLDVIVNSSQFQTLPPYQRALILTNTFKESRAAASGMVKMKNPQIVNDATQALLKKINKK